MLEALLQYGIAGVVVVVGTVFVIKPIVGGMLRQQGKALELLQKSVDANTKAIEAFQRFEQGRALADADLVETQKEILTEIRLLREAHKNGAA